MVTSNIESLESKIKEIEKLVAEVVEEAVSICDITQFGCGNCPLQPKYVDRLGIRNKICRLTSIDVTRNIVTRRN